MSVFQTIPFHPNNLFILLSFEKSMTQHWSSRYQKATDTEPVQLTSYQLKTGLTRDEVPEVDRYLRHRGGEPVLVDACGEPTIFGSRAYLIEGVAVILQGANRPLLVKKQGPSLVTVVKQLEEDLHLKRMR